MKIQENLKKILTLNKQTRIIISVVLAVLGLLCFAVISFYFGSPASDAADSPDNSSSDARLEISKGKNGFYGVSDNEGREIISYSWNSINALPDGNFIVSCIMNNEETFGIIDSEENVITAFAYSEIRYIDENIIVGKICDSGHYLLMRSDGSLYTDDEWNSYDISGVNIVLSKNRSKYNAVISGGRIVFKSFELKQNIGAFPVSFRTDTAEFSGSLSPYEFEKTAAAVSEYAQALSDGEKDRIKSLTSPEYCESITPLELIGRTISSISDASISPVNQEDGSCAYLTQFTVEYSFADDNDPENDIAPAEPVQTAEKISNRYRFTVKTEKTNEGIIIITASEYESEQP